MITFSTYGQKERSFDTDKINKYRSNSDYKYDEAIVESDDPIPPASNSSSSNSNNGPNPVLDTSTGGGLGTGGGIFFIILLVAVVAFVIYQMVKGGGFKTIKKDKSKEAIMTSLDDDQIVNVLTKKETEDLIQQAVNNGDFRRAVRLLYLASLKMLTDSKMISWEPNKTNSDYMYEIKNRDLRNMFKDTTLYYDYIWYGDREVDAGLFQKVHQSFNKFTGAIK